MRYVSVIGAIYFIISAQSISFVDSSLRDLSIVSDGYDFDDYVPAHQNRPDGPWIVSAESTFPSTDYVEKPFRSPINVDYETLDTSENHHGSINHVNNQFDSTFIPRIVDNSQLNSHPIRTQTIPMLCVRNHSNDMKCIDAVSRPKPFNGYVKHTFRSGKAYISNTYLCITVCMLPKIQTLQINSNHLFDFIFLLYNFFFSSWTIQFKCSRTFFICTDFSSASHLSCSRTGCKASNH